MVANYSAAGIPLDTIWSDIDYMHGWRDFTLDPDNFSAPDMRVRGPYTLALILGPTLPLSLALTPSEAKVMALRQGPNPLSSDSRALCV